MFTQHTFKTPTDARALTTSICPTEVILLVSTSNTKFSYTPPTVQRMMKQMVVPVPSLPPLLLERGPTPLTSLGTPLVGTLSREVMMVPFCPIRYPHQGMTSAVVVVMMMLVESHRFCCLLTHLCVFCEMGSVTILD